MKTLTFTYQDGAIDVENCCVISALSAVAGFDFTMVQESMEQMGFFCETIGCTAYNARKWLTAMKIEYAEAYLTANPKGSFSLSDFLKVADDTRNYFIVTDGHVQALVQGTHYNIAPDMNAKVEQIQVIENEDNSPEDIADFSNQVFTANPETFLNNIAKAA